MLAQIANAGVPPYADVSDFGEIFTEEMNSLYLLSFVLTADRDGRIHGMGASVGATHDHQASHSNDQACSGGHRSVVGGRCSVLKRQRPFCHTTF
jgi:hypothetical protein